MTPQQPSESRAYNVWVPRLVLLIVAAGLTPFAAAASKTPRSAKANKPATRPFELGLSAFSSRRLVGRRIEGLKVEDAVLRHSRLDRTTARRASVYNTDFSFSVLRSADLSESTISLTSFRSVDARGARFRELWSTECDFRGANLRGVDFTGSLIDSADLDGVDLSQTRLKDVALNASLYDSKTRWPRGFKPDPAGALLHPLALQGSRSIARMSELRPFLEAFEKAWRRKDWQTVSLACHSTITYATADEGFDGSGAGGSQVPRFMHRFLMKGSVGGRDETESWKNSFKNDWDLTPADNFDASEITLLVPPVGLPGTKLTFKRVDGFWRLTKIWRYYV